MLHSRTRIEGRSGRRTVGYVRTMGLLLCSKSCDDYRTVAKLCDDFAEPYPVLPTVQHLTLKSMIALIGYTNNPNHSYRFVLESG